MRLTLAESRRLRARRVEHELEALEAQYERRRSRFRILACVDESEGSLEAVREASRLGRSEECDVVAAHVRGVDDESGGGGLHPSVTRRNMLEWGMELHGVQHLQRALEILREAGLAHDEDATRAHHRDVWGDRLGDNKVEYRLGSEKITVLKLKTAPDAASGILDQYDLGPYNLIVTGAPRRWRREALSWFGSGTAQKVAALAPCSTMMARRGEGEGFLICVGEGSGSRDAAFRSAVLAHHAGDRATLFSACPRGSSRGSRRGVLESLREELLCRGVSSEIRLEDGDVREVIVSLSVEYRAASLASERHTWLERSFRGSVSFDVLRFASCSVLHVR